MIKSKTSSLAVEFDLELVPVGANAPVQRSSKSLFASCHYSLVVGADDLLKWAGLGDNDCLSSSLKWQQQRRNYIPSIPANERVPLSYSKIPLTKFHLARGLAFSYRRNFEFNLHCITFLFVLELYVVPFQKRQTSLIWDLSSTSRSGNFKPASGGSSGPARSSLLN